jgi:hypothetical protein
MSNPTYKYVSPARDFNVRRRASLRFSPFLTEGIKITTSAVRSDSHKREVIDSELIEPGRTNQVDKTVNPTVTTSQYFVKIF